MSRTAPTFHLVICFCVLIQSNAFTSPNSSRVFSSKPDNVRRFCGCYLNPPTNIFQENNSYHRRNEMMTLKSSENPNPDFKEEKSIGKELGGLATYLGPYALAFILSIGVTVAFVKFVLLDY